MVTRRRLFPGLLLVFALPLPFACSGADPNAQIHSPPAVDEGGAHADATTPAEGGSGSSSGGRTGGGSGGGPCGTISCSVDQDCRMQCGPTPQFGYVWCCGGGGCFQWSTATCPGEGPTPTPTPVDAGGSG